MSRYGVQDFMKDFPNDDVCLDVIFKERYGDVDTCPSCGVIGTKFHRVKSRKCYSCQWCGYQLYPLAETIFHKSSTPLTKWFYAIYLFSVSKNGVAALELQRHLKVTYKTAHRMARQIRSLMSEGNQIGGPGISVEADETYFGGKAKFRQKGKSGTSDKTPVMGVVEKDGSIRAKATDTPSVYVARKFLDEFLMPGSELHTDESNIYKKTVTAKYWHYAINHSRGEYSRGQVTTNTIEGFWGQLKRSISGTYHQVSRKHLQLYVDEFVFRYNLRGVVVYPVLLERASKRVLSKS